MQLFLGWRGKRNKKKNPVCNIRFFGVFFFFFSFCPISRAIEARENKQWTPCGSFFVLLGTDYFRIFRTSFCIHYTSNNRYIYIYMLPPLVVEHSREGLPVATHTKYQLIGLIGRVFANGPGDLGSIPGQVIPKTLKMVLDTSLLNTQQYTVCIKVNKTIQVRRTRHAGHCWRSRDELIRDVLLWIPTHGRAKAGRPARTYIQQLCEDTGCCPEDLPRAMNDREEWRERVRDIRATSAI